ncbi:MAG: superoxide dismutase [Nitrososphaerota archaeon]|nr:superoxide dismutase [Nitrososphaerota archaeon]MDG7051032.1 superoxide dismutase [Nitrososphaerota archaeon]
MSGNVRFSKYELPQLPYKVDALEPYISSAILDVHYNGHHKAYVNGFNATLEKVDKILKGEVNNYDMQGVIRNLIFNANGHKLHSLYWENMAPAGKGGGRPGGKLGDLIEKQFGSYEKFKAIFTENQKSLPGTGWAVLYYDPEKQNLLFTTFENHFMNQIVELPVILITDEFEHAYYLQYKNNRNAYLDAWWNIVNWSDADRRLSKYL